MSLSSYASISPSSPASLINAALSSSLTVCTPYIDSTVFHNRPRSLTYHVALIETSEDMFVCFDRMHECDRHTDTHRDRQTLHDDTGRTSIASRGKNHTFLTETMSPMSHYTFFCNFLVNPVQLYALPCFAFTRTQTDKQRSHYVNNML